MNTRADADLVIATWLARAAVERAPQHLVEAARARVDATRQHRRLWDPRHSRAPGLSARSKLAVGAIAVAAVAIVAVVVAEPWHRSTEIGPGASSPGASPTPVATASERVHGFPGRFPIADNPPGRYSWDLRRDGWIHRHGCPDRYCVSINFRAIRTTPGPGATETVVAGFPATVHTFTKSSGHQVWRYVAAIGTTWVTIDVEVDGPRPNDEDVAEGLTVMASLRPEWMPLWGRYRLTFDLPAGWDSQ